MIVNKLNDAIAAILENTVDNRLDIFKFKLIVHAPLTPNIILFKAKLMRDRRPFATHKQMGNERATIKIKKMLPNL